MPAMVLRNAERINNNNKILLNTTCIIQFLVSQGNRAERKKKIPEIWGVLDIFTPILKRKCISCLLPSTMHQLSYVPFKAA